MSFTEIKEALVTLSVEERAQLQEQLNAMEEGVSVEELRAINRALDEAINDPSPNLTLEEVTHSIKSLKLDDVP